MKKPNNKIRAIKWEEQPNYLYHDYERGAESVYVNGLSDVVEALETINRNLVRIGKLLEVPKD